MSHDVCIGAKAGDNSVTYTYTCRWYFVSHYLRRTANTNLMSSGPLILACRHLLVYTESAAKQLQVSVQQLCFVFDSDGANVSLPSLLPRAREPVCGVSSYKSLSEKSSNHT
jgi:hypothetical protein